MEKVDKRKRRYRQQGDETIKVKVSHESVNIAEYGRGASEDFPGRQRL